MEKIKFILEGIEQEGILCGDLVDGDCNEYNLIGGDFIETRCYFLDEVKTMFMVKNLNENVKDFRTFMAIQK